MHSGIRTGEGDAIAHELHLTSERPGRPLHARCLDQRLRGKMHLFTYFRYKEGTIFFRELRDLILGIFHSIVVSSDVS